MCDHRGTVGCGARAAYLTVGTLILVAGRSNIATGSALFHLLASLFFVSVRSAEAALRKDTPVEEIRQLRALGRSVAEIARKTGETVATVRRIVGKLDPAEKESRRKEQEATAARINSRSEPWMEKVR